MTNGFVVVIDTGSPFLLVDGSNSACFEQRWGCYRPQSGGSGLRSATNPRKAMVVRKFS